MVANYSLIQSLQMGIITGLLLISGISTCLSVWIVPLLFLAPAQLLTAQFATVIAKGARYLQTGGRMSALGLAVLAYSVSKHPDPTVAIRWRYHASSLVVLLLFAPFEVFVIFPLNDTIEEIGDKLREKRENCADEKIQAQLVTLLKKWQARNLIRAMLVLASALICLFDVVSSQSL